MRTPSVSPDGHWLAYDCSPVCILDLTGHSAELNYPMAHLGWWSQDSSTLAVTSVDANGHSGEATLHVADGAAHQIPPIQGAAFAPIGWVDSTHLAGYYDPSPPTPTPPPASTPRSSGSSPLGAQTVTLAVQDITTGAAHTVFSLTSSSMGLPDLLLAPDGRHALFYNKRWRDDPYTPDVRLIDMSTGAVTSLSQIAQVLGQGLGTTSIAWRAGSLTLAASTGFLANGDLKTWVVDAQHDTAQLLLDQDHGGGYVGGWAPDSDTLVLTTTYFSYGYAGPFTLTAIANAISGPGTATTLTTDAYTFSFAGFARTSP